MSQDITPAQLVSPFDQKRRVDENGEYWLAYEIYEDLGYSWRRFPDVIKRAYAAIKNNGEDPNQHIIHSTVSSSEGRGGPRDEWRLSRYGAYAVVQAGEPTKTEIAAGWAYFRVKTREAETGIQLPTNLLEALELAVVTERARMEAEQRAQLALIQVQELSPKAEEYDEYVNSKGYHTLAEAAQMMHNTKGVPIGRQRVINKLYDLQVLCKPTGNESLRPRQEYLEQGWFECHPITYKRGNRNVPYMQTFVTPLGITGIFKKLHKNGEDIVEPIVNG